MKKRSGVVTMPGRRADCTGTIKLFPDYDRAPAAVNARLSAA